MNYEKVTIEVVEFNTSDIITGSGDSPIEGPEVG